jgi:hypothetical protein
MRSFRFAPALLAACLVFGSLRAHAAKASDPFVGRWALTIPGGGAGWLGIEDKGNYLDGSILWGGGSVLPLESVYVNGDALIVTRINTLEEKDKDGKVIRTRRLTETITAKIKGTNDLDLVQSRPESNGQGVSERPFTGKRIPDLPPAPKLSKVKFDKAVTLFNGKDLTGWTLTNPSARNGWSVKDGVLTNEAPRSGVAFGNLRTTGEFEDFNLALEVKVATGGNSGVYLRGIYEVQVEDTFGKPLDSHNMGAMYSRITPSSAAEKPAGEWQSLDITLVDRHVTVVLNGTKIIDNQPLLGCTGGALTSDEFKPGPIYLQGDHGSIEYRNIVLKPVRK